MIKEVVKNTFYKVKEIHSFVKFNIYSKVKKKQVQNNNKILIIAHDFNKAGAQVLLLNIVKELSDRNNDIILIARGRGGLEKDFRRCVPTYIATFDNIFAAYIKIFCNRGYKVAITNTVITGNIIPILKRHNIKVISLIHELPMLINQGGFINSAKNVASKSDIVIFPSSFVEKKFYEVSKVINKVIIKPQGLYLNKDHKPDKNNAKEELNRLYNIPKENKVVLNVASGIIRKGFDWFLEIAIKSLQYKELSFIWVGDYDIKIYEDIINRYNIDEIPNLILAGYINNSKELVKFYDSSEILMLTSREEPFGSIVLEAFNSETPVLAFRDAGGFVDTVIEDETGFLVEYANIDSMKKRLIQILNNEEKLLEMAKRCKSSLVNYKFEDYISMIEELTKTFI